MNPSARVAGINGAGGSDGWEILYQARRLRRQGVPVLDLTVGDHDWTTDTALIDVMAASARGGNTGYASVPGAPDLRAAIAARVQTHTGVPTAPENVVVTPGGQAALFAALMATLDPGDTALLLDPHYATYPGTVRSASGIPVVLPTRAEAGFQPEAPVLEAAPAAQALLINSPNNPSGAVYSAQTMAEIAAFAQTRDMWVISDEVYDGQVWEGTHLSARAVPGLAGRCLVVGSLSKSHAMTGWRLGWVVGPAEVIAMIADLATNTTYGVPGFIQDAALAALTEGDAIEAAVVETYRQRRAAVLAALSGQNTVGVVPAQGGMYVMLDIRDTGRSGTAFAQALFDQHRVAAMPGESFGAACAGHLRVALTRPADELVTAMETLVRFAKETS